MEAFHKLKIECPYSILNIEDIKICCRPSEHGYLYIKCLIDDSLNFKYATEASTEDKIVLYEELENNEKSIIFNGIVQNIKTTNKTGLYYLELEAASSSINLDIAEKTRSFQDYHMSYDNLVKEILRDYKIYGFTQCMSEPRSIGKPLFQYKETDWDFLKRVASHLGLELICDIIKSENAFFLGRPTGKSYEVRDDINYKACKDLDAYHKALSNGFGVDFHDTDFFYYEVEVRDKLEIGDIIYFKQKNLYVNQFEAELQKGELIYKYRFCRKDGIWIDKLYNHKIKGVSLEGKVLERNRETLKLHLNIDEGQNPATAAWFYYTPPTGNILYSMPLVGENAMLYFQDEIKAAPIATNCVRKNGEACDDFSDTNNRYLATETGDYLDMLPGAINFHRSGLNVNLNDENGITFSSSGNLSVSGGSVSISGGSVSINASSKIRVQKGKSGYISIENEFYVKGSIVYQNGSDRQSYGAFTDDEPTAGVADVIAITKKIGESIMEISMGLLISAMAGSKACVGSAIDTDSTQIKDVRLGAKPPSNPQESVYEIKGEDNKSLLDDLNDGLNSTKPLIPWKIPKGDDIIPKVLGSATGSFSEAVASIEKKAEIFTNSRGTIELYPNNSNVNFKPYKKISKIGTLATAVTTVFDIANTWSEDNGNTVGQRIIKTGIQATGVYVSTGVGVLTGELAAAGVAGAPESGGVSLLAVPAAAAIDYEASALIDKAQDKLYDFLGIK
ncbi:hypothetical protein [Clostridium sp. YIM B02555]|uniref:hypothetical protein n=1 Tax=Clostridium sp. YIM B02555 TaxID=2911968 RepID=UPI001EED6550|nr:hypothetical protein [Clostridium sp. YIM B02555]